MAARIYPHGHEPGADPSRDLVHELLIIGRERVARPGGWSQEGLIDDRTGAVNIIGAVTVSDRQPWFDIVVQRKTLKALVDQLPFYWCVGSSNEEEILAGWNNAPWRRQKVVVELFEEAIRSRDNG